MGRSVRSQPPVQAGGPLNSVREGRGRAWDSLGRLRAASRTGVRSRPMRTLWCWGPKSPHPAVSRPPTPSPSWASSAALTSSPGPAVSRARTRFKPARRRPRRALDAPRPPARHYAPISRELGTLGGALGGAGAPPWPRPQGRRAPTGRLDPASSTGARILVFFCPTSTCLVIGLNARSGRNC